MTSISKLDELKALYIKVLEIEDYASKRLGFSKSGQGQWSRLRRALADDIADEVVKDAQANP